MAQTQHPPSELPEKMKDPFVNQTPGPKNEAGTRVLDSQLFRKYASVHTPEHVSAIRSEHAAWLGLEGVMLMEELRRTGHTLDDSSGSWKSLSDPSIWIRLRLPVSLSVVAEVWE